MIKKTVAELHFVRTSEPMATVEIDLDSISPEQYGYSELVDKALIEFAQRSPTLRATIYVYQGPSYNFGVSGYSAFFGVAGDKRVLSQLYATFKSTPGLQARYSDSILASRSLCQYHIEGGRLWEPLEEGVWYTGEAGDESANDDVADELDKEDDDLAAEHESDEGDGEGGAVAVADGTRQKGAVPSRYRIARADASIASIRRTIESVFGLPEGSVALRGPDGKNIKGNASIATLRKRWQ